MTTTRAWTLATALLLFSCFTGSSEPKGPGAAGGAGSGVPGGGVAIPDIAVSEAIEIVASDEAALDLVQTGDGVGARYDFLLSGGLPAANALIAQGAAAIDAIAAELAEGPDYERDEEFASYAFILERIGDRKALGPLADFLERTLTSDFSLQSANAATNAIFEILERDETSSLMRSKDSYWYSLRDMEFAVSTAQIAADLDAISAALTFTGGSCHMRYIFLDRNGNVIQCPTADGGTEPCAIGGVVFQDVTKVSKQSVDLRNQAEMHGAVFPTEFDGGSASRRYNCAGYAFREINRNSSWTSSASEMLNVLTAAGLLRKKSGPPAKGDKIFFRPSEGWKFWTKNEPAHVGEIRIENGKAIVRAPDNFSGVFDLPIDAKYWDEVRSFSYELYEWVDGKPTAIPDPDFTSNPSYCGDPFADHCPNGSCDVALDETSDNCSGDCTTDDGICDPFEKQKFEETPESPWYQDCGSCGDGFCDRGTQADSESAANCEADCGTCGNGVCNEVDPNELTDECWVSEVNGINCSTDCCSGATTLCSHGISLGCEGP